MSENRFDTTSQNWDERPTPNKVADAFSSYLHEHELFKAGDTILDYGCGTGILLLQLTDLGYMLEGMDNSEGMLEKVQAKIAEQNISNVKLTPHHGDAEELPLEAYDGIISSLVLHHIEHTDSFLKKCHGALKEGGRLCIADIDTEDGGFHPKMTDDIKHLGFDRDALETLLRSIGFKDVYFETLITIDREKRSYPVFVLKAFK